MWGASSKYVVLRLVGGGGDHVTRLAGGCRTQGPLQPVITHLTNGPNHHGGAFHYHKHVATPGHTSRAGPRTNTGAPVVCFYEVWSVESVKQAA